MCPIKKRKVSTGSGKRFTSEKPRPQTAEPVRTTRRPPSSAETSLRSRISHFGISERFKEDFNAAFEQYFGPDSIRKEDGKTILLIDDGEAEGDLPGFQEWYYQDYRLQSGERIMDLFAQEIGPQLSFVQRKILQDWQATNYQRLMEVQSVTPGVGETVQDLLSGEVMSLNDISFSYAVSRWSVVLVRPLLTEGHWSFTGSGIVLSPLDKERILKIAQGLWSAYQEQHPQASVLDFYRDHSLDLRQAGILVRDDRANPLALTAEGHPAIAARADFRLLVKRAQVQEILDQSEEYVHVNDEDDGEFAGCSHYLWLLRGRSSAPEEATQDLDRPAYLLSTRWTAGEGEPDFLNLGDMYICKDRLVLLCTSKERLQVGKELLEEIVGKKKIQHSKDDFQPLRVESDSQEQSQAISKQPLDPEGQRVEDELLEQMTLEWLDKPSFDGITPRQMAQTPEGLIKLIESLKMIDYLAEEARRQGKKPPMRLDIILEELGLDTNLF